MASAQTTPLSEEDTAFRKGLDKAERAQYDAMAPADRERWRRTAAWAEALTPEQKAEHKKLGEREQRAWFELTERGSALNDAEARERWRLASFEAIVELAAQDDWAAARSDEGAALPHEWADAAPPQRHELIEAWAAEAQPLSPDGRDLWALLPRPLRDDVAVGHASSGAMLDALPDGTRPLWRALLLAPWAIAGGSSSSDERAGLARSGHDAVADAVASADAAVAATGGDAAAEAEAAAWRDLEWAEKAARLLCHRYGMDVDAAAEGGSSSGVGAGAGSGSGGGEEGGGGGGESAEAAPSLVERCRWEAAEEEERRELVALRHHREHMVRPGIERQRCAATDHSLCTLRTPNALLVCRCLSPPLHAFAPRRARALLHMRRSTCVLLLLLWLAGGPC